MTSSSRPALAGRVLAGSLAFGALALAGCGSVVAADAGSSGSGSTTAPSAGTVPPGQVLCARPAAASRVVVARTNFPRPILPVRQSQAGASSGQAQAAPSGKPGKPGALRRPEPFVVKVVTSAARVHALAQAVCALPALPRGRINCPALITGSYQLTFTVAGRRLPAVSAQLAGCETVTGAGIVRSASTRPAFWKLLAKIAGPATGLPVHLPGGPVVPGGPLQPRGPSCSPPSKQVSPAAPTRTCLGPDRPIATTRP
jgi:hypothetical protein